MSSPDVLVQIHIPKCAGTSVSKWLRDAALDGVISGFRALYPDYVYAQSELEPLGFEDPRLAAVSTHNIRRFDPTIGGRRMHYFTVLREPVTQFLSAARYMLQDRSLFGVPVSVGTVRELAVWMLGRSIDAPFRDNMQTNHLALYPWCDATAGRCRPDLRESWSTADRTAYERERLDIAKNVLRTFLAVGTVERLNETMELVRQRSAAFGMHLLPVEKLGHHNVTRVPTGDLTWIESDPAGARLRESVAVDRELYLFAQQLLDDARGHAETQP